MNQLHDHILSLLQGKTKPTTEITAYLMEKMKNLQAETSAMEANIEQSQRRLESFRVRWTELNAQQKKYAEDLEFWVQKEQDAAKPKVVDIVEDEKIPELKLSNVAITVDEAMREPKPENSDGLKSKTEAEYKKSRDQFYAAKSKPEDTNDGHSATDDRPSTGNDQHRDEGPGAPQEVAPGVRTPMASVQRERPSGGPPMAGGGASAGGDNFGVSGPP